MPLIKKVSICVALLLFVTASAVPQNNSGQVIFSKTGGLMTIVGNSNNVTSTPFGFWIWCNADTAPNSNGGYQAAHACQGEMYFYGFFHNSLHVIGQSTEGAEGVYTMHVVQGTAAQLFSNTLNPSFTCSLTNVTPGGGDSVSVNCVFLAQGGGMGSATVTGAIVNITGP